MVKKPIRLRFTEDDLSDPRVKSAYEKAQKQTDKAERAVERITSGKNHHKLRDEASISVKRKEKLRFTKANIEEEIKKPSRVKQVMTRSAVTVISVKAHQAVTENADNIGVQAADDTVRTAESAGYAADHLYYSHKLKSYDKAEKMVEKSDRANVNALFERFKKENPGISSNPLSLWQQKHKIKKEYAAARAGKSTAKSGASKGTAKAVKQSGNIVEKAAEFCVSNKKVMLILLAVGLLFMLISGLFTSCTAMFQGGTQAVLGSSFTAEDEDILGVDEDYTAMEDDLHKQIEEVESLHPGYDEYRYHLDEIGHNPYVLASYLTVIFEDYTREEVQSEIVRLFKMQYELKFQQEVEIRTKTITDEDGNTTTVEYEYRILHVYLVNHSLEKVVEQCGLNEDQLNRYYLLLETLGNRPYLFGDDIYAIPGAGDAGYDDYDIPGEALTNERFANMMQEAEKYLGYPYVWGGSSPSTSFDCSGFVSWVINHCGNGWNVGRQTASGLKNLCQMVPPSQAQAGDLIFFEGTYDSLGPISHVGIYVGNGMMIHCGNPISYANINTSYWQEHFYGFGRLE